MIPDTPQTLLRKIAEYAQGDDAAEWAKFAELYEPVIRLYIAQSRTVSAADADDIVQDIFIKLVEVLRNGEYKREKGSFRTYLAAMVRRLLIDRYRRETTRFGKDGTAPLSDNIPSDLPDPSAIVDMRLALARHNAAIDHVLTRTMLEKRTVAAYREYALDGLPAAEVAARYGMTVNNLRQLKHRIDRMIAAVESAYER